ncbi:RNA polymerase sigma factor [Aquihabitans daechungensis]|uniref:RNA polymerase sigma factor n=1 Tax=Aquihabitans daechungensis TaxID=1052257 RepID=UPI003B9DC9F3
MTDAPTADDIARIFRDESGRCIATLVRVLGSIDLAEDAVQEAFVTAAQKWPADGLPPNPGAWITTTARNRAIDRLRRESTRDVREAEATAMTEPAEPLDVGALPDDQLRLIFTCCHPALSVEAQLALTLRLIAGLQTPEIAHAFLVPEATMAQRIVRAKKKITATKLPYRVPDAAELPGRLRSVLAVLYLIFTEGHRSSTSDALVRQELCAEAIRLSRLVCDLMPEEPEAVGLLALMLLTDSRRETRVDDDGVLVPLPDQDRTRWDREEIAEGHDLVRRCLRRNQPGAYQVQAAIAAVHTDAATAQETDWVQILALYDQLVPFAPTPVVQLNRAVAVAEVRGPAEALAEVELLDLEGYVPYHATRADLLRRVGRTAEAIDAYDQAIVLTTADPERRFLQGRRAALT